MVNKLKIIDYKTGGNLFSLCNSLTKLGADFEICSNPVQLKDASKIIFPGVGSFGKAMEELENLNLIESIIDAINKRQIYFLGICVGMQVLFEQGEEGGLKTGLGLIPGKVSKFDINICPKIPHMGWNVIQGQGSPLIKSQDHLYFVHSYCAKLEDNEREILRRFPQAKIYTSTYQENFISHFWNGENLFACQFHPEKSGEAGLKILQKFLDLI